MNSIPSKDELRKKYGITEGDFQVLTQAELPAPDALLKEGAYIQKVGFWDRFEVWLKKTVVGQVLIAVIFIGGVISGLEAINKYGTIIYTNREQIVVTRRELHSVRQRQG